MAKLYFRYGTVGSGKTLSLLAVAHTYRQQGKEVLLIKPKIDTRFGSDQIRSRCGLEMIIDLLVDEYTELLSRSYKGISCLLVDEAQFIPEQVIDDLREITLRWDLPVICYGLRTDFRRNLFTGSKRLIELADSIEEVKSTCYFCNKKSIFNLKHHNDKPSLDGPSIELGLEDLYYPVCFQCYRKKLSMDQANTKQEELVPV